MEISIPKTGETLLRVARKAGYTSSRDRQSFVRLLTPGGYPRFHVYAEDRDDAWVFKLHLDQKKPSYASGHAHAGEYSGEVVEAEGERIQKLLTK